MVFPDFTADPHELMIKQYDEATFCYRSITIQLLLSLLLSVYTARRGIRIWCGCEDGES